jgi:2-C-methyl-D-erythritol 2,4-cyclodiphosphate synthase/2-C-methyl-D-erythritol 4-phosphate cytidylyltransferase
LNNQIGGVSAVIAAAGQGNRMDGVNKLALPLRGVPVLARTLLAFENAECITEIIVAARPGGENDVFALAEKYGVTKLKAVTAGSDTRQKSVAEAVKLCNPASETVCVHDGARPLITPELINKAVETAAKTAGGAALAVRVKDTVKMADGNQIIAQTPNRSQLWNVQTPQVFPLKKYKQALSKAFADGCDFTDDCALFEHSGLPVTLETGDYKNIKITTPEDITVAEAFVQFQIKDSDIGDNSPKNIPVAAPQALVHDGEKALRIGHGYDVHRLVPERKLILGGVHIPHTLGLLGHSDADVLLHAVTDALLGAAALGDIGRHFPPGDAEYKDADSRKFLKQVGMLLAKKGYTPGNIDATVVAQRPQLAPYINEMRENIAGVLGIHSEFVNVKATTEENLGFSGREEGIAAHAVCTVIYTA